MSKDEVEIARDEADSVLSGSSSFIAVVQSKDLGHRHDCSAMLGPHSSD